MSRPKGSLNKKTIEKMARQTRGNNLQIMKFDKQVEGSAVMKVNPSGNWVSWGSRNDYPVLLLNLYNESPTHAACINFSVQSVIGDGVDYEKSDFDGGLIVPNYAQTWDELMKSVSLDYMLYGTYAIEIIMNNDGKTFSFYHIPMEKVRCAEYDEDGQITKYFICSDWSKVNQLGYTEVDAFDMKDASVIKKGKVYLYVYKPYSPTVTYYAAPHYTSAIKAIQTEIEYLNFDLRTVNNNFTPCGAVILPAVETDEERAAIIKNLTNMFTSSDNANSLLIQFRENEESKGIEFVPFTHSTENVDLYESANLRCVNRILAAHQINDPQLIGLPNLGGTGFNSEGQLLETAYMVYNKVVGNSNRNNIVKTFNFMLQMQGLDTQIVLKPLSFVLDSNKEVIQPVNEEVEQEVDTNDIKEDNIEEKTE